MKIASPGATSRRQRVAGADERDRLARHHHLRPLRPLAGAERERPDAERIAKGEQPVPGDQRDDRVRAANPPVHGAHRVEDDLGRERQVARRRLDLVREHVDQHLGVALGVDVAPVDVEQLLLERRRVGEVAVVDEDDAVRRVDVERLRLLLAVGAAGGRVAHLAEADPARQRPHVAGAKDVADHAARLLHEALRPLHGDDAGRVLAAVLEQQQGVVDQLVDRATCRSRRRFRTWLDLRKSDQRTGRRFTPLLPAARRRARAATGRARPHSTRPRPGTRARPATEPPA